MTRLLFVGDSWQGSTARSLREALGRRPGVSVVDVAEDHYLPNYRARPLRAVNRLLFPLQTRELEAAIVRALDGAAVDAAIVYKGRGVGPRALALLKARGVPAVNIFPDCSPHAHGESLREAMGLYDLVVTAKPFHPALWRSTYGYANRCEFVPHGYDPTLHLWDEPVPGGACDVALCATWRPEYRRLLIALAAALPAGSASFSVAGQGWLERRADLPAHWKVGGPRTGRGYGEFLRGAKIVLAPITREMHVGGAEQPGDVDSTRTYELAAANCFFLHQRTEYAQTLYDGASEVPFWNDAQELAALIRRWLPDEPGRRAAAARAHARAVPAYSIDARAAAVLSLLAREGLLR